MERCHAFRNGIKYSFLTDEMTLFVQSIFKPDFPETLERFLESRQSREAFLKFTDFRVRVLQCLAVLLEVTLQGSFAMDKRLVLFDETFQETCPLVWTSGNLRYLMLSVGLDARQDVKGDAVQHFTIFIPDPRRIGNCSLDSILMHIRSVDPDKQRYFGAIPQNVPYDILMCLVCFITDSNLTDSTPDAFHNSRLAGTTSSYEDIQVGIELHGYVIEESTFPSHTCNLGMFIWCKTMMESDA